MRQSRSKFITVSIMAVVVMSILFLMGCSTDKKDSDLQAEKDGTEKNEQEVLIEDFEIETPDCTLYYPAKWKEQVRIETVEGNAYRVEFYGQVEGKEEQHLFDIAFGGEEGYTLGHLTTRADNRVAVNIISYDFEPSEDWQDAEANTIYAMQEDINYIIDKLEELDEFEILQ